jgi:hypothetical protein
MLWTVLSLWKPKGSDNLEMIQDAGLKGPPYCKDKAWLDVVYLIRSGHIYEFIKEAK